MSVLVSDQDRGGDALARIAPSKTVKLSEYSKSSVDGVWRIAGHDRTRRGTEQQRSGLLVLLAPRRCTSRHSSANIIAISYFGLTFSQYTGFSFKKWRYSSQDRRMRGAVDVPGERQPSSPVAITPPPTSPSPKSEHDFDPHCRHSAICPEAVRHPLKSCSLFKGAAAWVIERPAGWLFGSRRCWPQVDWGSTCRPGLRVF